MLKTLLRYVGKYKVASLLTPLFTALEVVVDVLIPWVTAHLIDEGLNASDLGQVYRYGALMVLMAGGSLLFGILAGRFSAYASSGFAANLRNAMYRHIQTFAFSDIDKYTTAGLITHMTTDVNNLQDAYQQVLHIAVRAPFRLVLSIVMCLIINLRLSLIFVVALAVLTGVLVVVLRKVSGIFAQVYRQYDQLNLSVEENLSAIRVVKAFVREDYEKERFRVVATGLRRLNERAEGIMALMHPVMNLVVYGCIIALSWFGAHFVVGGSLSMGELTSLFTYIMSILMSLMMLSMIFVRLSSATASGKRVAQVLTEQADITNPPAPITTVPNGSIDFKQVCFSYQIVPGENMEERRQRLQQQPVVEYALRDITLHIDAGQSIGIIGGTGSGKSTLVQLVSRLYDVASGTVLVGGHDVQHYDLTTLRNAVSVVLQSNRLFSGTVLDNLRWGNPHATEADCRRACQWACADEFVQAMPGGYQARVEQNGANLSGGQRQRLCIARALLKTPQVLVLDDSTSACDTATDARIQQSLHQHLPHITLLLVSQRITTLRQCDKILVLDAGAMVGFGTHTELLATCPVYQDICHLQEQTQGDFDEPNPNVL